MKPTLQKIAAPGVKPFIRSAKPSLAPSSDGYAVLDHIAAAKRKLHATKHQTLPIAMDSGAFGLYMRHGAPKDSEGKRIRGKGFLDLVNHNYRKLPEFRTYLDNYMEFVKAHGDKMTFCVSLDVIFNAEATWEIYNEITREGLHVLPVYHYGEDPKYLKRYMDATDYIGLGGLVKTGDKASSKRFQQATWGAICDSKGRPKVKVHGFGVTSFEPIMSYPFYSLDSTTSTTWSRYGCIMMPQIIGKRYDYLIATPKIFPLTEGRARAPKHFHHQHPNGHNQAGILEWLEGLGLTLEETAGGYGERDIANLAFMNRFMRALSQRHTERLDMQCNMIYYASGNFTGTAPVFVTSCNALGKLKEVDYLAYLGTFDNPNPVQRIYSEWYGKQMVIERIKGKGKGRTNGCSEDA